MSPSRLTDHEKDVYVNVFYVVAAVLLRELKPGHLILACSVFVPLFLLTTVWHASRPFSRDTMTVSRLGSLTTAEFVGFILTVLGAVYFFGIFSMISWLIVTIAGTMMGLNLRK